MNDVITVRSAEHESLRKYAMLGYAMHLFGLISIIGFIVGLIIAWIKREDAAGTIYVSHFAWQSRSFWWFVLWFLLLMIPTVLTVGFIPFFLIAQIWFGYRMIKGWMRLNQDRVIG